MEYRNFDISIEESTEGYLIKVQAGDSGEARSHFSLDLSNPEFQKTLVRLSNHQVDRESQIEFGLMLYSHLFTGDIERLFHEYNGNVFDNGDVGIRIRLRIYPPEIASIPWELLYSPISKQFLSTSESYPLVRYIELPQRIRKLKAAFPVNILVAIPEYPSSYFPLDASREKASLLEALEDLRDSVNIHFIEGKVTRTKISDALLERQFHCFHFIGHGDFTNDKGTLLLNSEKGDIDAIDPVDDIQFASLVQNHPSMKLVVLNSCKGAEVSTIQPMVGLAPRLVQNGIPAVIAMQYAIYDEAAVSFAREFYRKLFRGYNAGRVDMAISHARNILGNNPSTQNDMCTPVLFMRSATGTLFDLDTGWIIGVPFTKDSFQAAQSASAQYSFNQTIEQHAEDSEGLKQIKQKIRYGRYAVASAIVAVIVMFSLLWVKAFDILTLDTKSEALTMGVGNKLVPAAISHDLALIGFVADRSEDADKRREKWRKQHALMIEKLARAGASVVVFDIAFESETPVDSELITAINQAKQVNETTTIIGYADLKNKNDFSRPKINAAILSSEVLTGMVVAGKKMGLARTIVLAAEKENTDKKRIPEYSVVLKAYSAFKNSEISEVDAEHMQIVIKGNNNIDISEYKKVRGNQKGVIQKGDYVAQNYFDYSPIRVLRKEYSHPYEEVINQYDEQALEQAFKGKIVLIGEQNSADQFGVLAIFGLDRYGYELLAEALNSLLNGRTIKTTNVWIALFLMVLSGALGAFLRYYVHFHSMTSRIFLLTAISVIYFAITIYVYTEFLILINIIYQISTLFFSYWITGKLIQRRNV